MQRPRYSWSQRLDRSAMGGIASRMAPRRVSECNQLRFCDGKVCAALGDSEGDAACRDGRMSGLIATATQQIRSNSVVLRNSAFMSLGSASAAVLGFVYW